ncbi:MAG TPA: BMP family ABC transporter substrate-binding protein [Candidatus Ornithospirochaeta avicola]|uniref:BMP family ABC transporter substrate-binding protein n=1 Tax=Candidatus Ornithospirochaeta avicola TaxID=2840896 RepID=A0A9D1PT62_9SPIO|nr:BMP family ABC transporter substrate-binding protein [Candidatus Ornithospirochaeta avicola]
MKKLLAVLLALVVVFSFASCSKDEAATTTTASSSTTTTTAVAEKEEPLKLGMVTDAGTIDDRSFNQGTYEGVVKAAEELGLESTYLRPSGTTTTDYLTAISDLYDQGYRFIACPGYLFAEAVAQAQEMYPDLKIIIIDDPLSAGIGENTVAITFREHEAGFLAGVATALKLGEGEVGFVGGLEIPSVQKFNWGFQQGVAYANENMGTDIAMNANNFVYSGSFADLALGQQLATAMYDSGVDAIFAAAGGTGVGVINEAKNRRLSGSDVWAIGVDVDQYSVGDMGNGESCILTSAMKDVAGVAYDQAVAAAKGTYNGGVHIELGIAEDRAGIPASNPNLTPEIEEQVAQVVELIKAGEITIQSTGDGLIK